LQSVTPAVADGRDRPTPIVFVGCSGHFIVERIRAANSLADLQGNDVTLTSCAMGAYLSGPSFYVEVKDDNLAWLGDGLCRVLSRLMQFTPQGRGPKG
jgi:hypothetical protein